MSDVYPPEPPAGVTPAMLPAPGDWEDDGPGCPYSGGS